MAWPHRRGSDDDAAFEALVRPLLDRLVRSTTLLCGSRAQAEDVVQDVLARWYALPRWDTIDHPEAYLRQMVVNQFLAHRRRRASTEVVLADLPEPDRRQHAPPGIDPAQRIDIMRALAGLSRTDRVVVVLRYLEDLSVAETAEILRCSSGAVRVRSLRALNRLRSALDPPTETYSTVPRTRTSLARQEKT